jgi:hypothetical protein
VILVVSELLSQEEDFRRYCCPATSDDVHKLQSIPQQFPDDEDGADVASPGDLKSKHESFSFAQNGTGFTNGRKLLEFEPALIPFYELPRFLRSTGHENALAFELIAKNGKWIVVCHVPSKRNHDSKDV